MFNRYGEILQPPYWQIHMCFPLTIAYMGSGVFAMWLRYLVRDDVSPFLHTYVLSNLCNLFINLSNPSKFI